MLLLTRMMLVSMGLLGENAPMSLVGGSLPTFSVLSIASVLEKMACAAALASITSC